MRPSDITDGIAAKQPGQPVPEPLASMRPSDITDGIADEARRMEGQRRFNEAVGYYRRNPAELEQQGDPMGALQ